MRSIIKRIVTGPELSKDISRDEARAGMGLVLEGKVDPVQAGIFLIASSEEADDVAAVFDAKAVAQAAADAGMETLAGKAGPTRDALTCAGAVCLWHLKRYDTLKEAADAVRYVLDLVAGSCAFPDFLPRAQRHVFLACHALYQHQVAIALMIGIVEAKRDDVGEAVRHRALRLAGVGGALAHPRSLLTKPAR